MIEHPNRKGQGFAFIGDNKPKEEAADVFRFEVPVAAKKDLSYTVVEERRIGSNVQLTNNADDQIRYFINLKEASPGLEGQAARSAQGEGEAGTRLRQDIQAANAAHSDDHGRPEAPAREPARDAEGVAAVPAYLKTLEEQEKEMDELQAKLKTLQGDEAAAKKGLDEIWET